jgi:predicted nucleic acid-binding protein
MPHLAHALIDTGGILALLDRDDRWHQPCVEAFQGLRLPLLTSEAVVTELFHLVGDSKHEMQAAWRFLRSGAIRTGVIPDTEWPDLAVLMSRYSDRPMDFADATLVHLATRESISLILTVDHDDFETYRFSGKRRFHILPDRARKTG